MAKRKRKDYGDTVEPVDVIREVEVVENCEDGYEVIQVLCYDPDLGNIIRPKKVRKREV